MDNTVCIFGKQLIKDNVTKLSNISSTLKACLSFNWLHFHLFIYLMKKFNCVFHPNKNIWYIAGKFNAFNTSDAAEPLVLSHKSLQSDSSNTFQNELEASHNSV